MPGFSGQYGSSTASTKFAGSIDGEYVPLIGAKLDAGREVGVALDRDTLVELVGADTAGLELAPTQAADRTATRLNSSIPRVDPIAFDGVTPNLTLR